VPAITIFYQPTVERLSGDEGYTVWWNAGETNGDIGTLRRRGTQWQVVGSTDGVLYDLPIDAVMALATAHGYQPVGYQEVPA
jgi:hypothetical protein